MKSTSYLLIPWPSASAHYWQGCCLLNEFEYQGVLTCGCVSVGVGGAIVWNAYKCVCIFHIILYARVKRIYYTCIANISDKYVFDTFILFKTYISTGNVFQSSKIDYFRLLWAYILYRNTPSGDYKTDYPTQIPKPSHHFLMCIMCPYPKCIASSELLASIACTDAVKLLNLVGSIMSISF